MLRSSVAPLTLALTLGAARALAEPESITGAYSEYELQAIHDAEADLGAHVDPSPEGKIIEHIDFVRLDPVDRHDPLPSAIDAVHTTSKRHVLRRELVVREGMRWDGVLVDESARNLRKLEQLSLVLCVPMRGSAPDRVRLVVITKDVWSLYVDWDLAVTSGGLEQLTLEPKESNIAGLHHEGLGRFVIEPEALTFGAGYHVPRLAGRWLDVAVDANVTVNRASGEVEGGYGSLVAKRPLFSSRTEWAWSSETWVVDQLRRRYVNAKVAPFVDDALPGVAVPWVWRERSFEQDAKITRSFGWELKNDFSLGASYSHARYIVPNESALDPRAVAAFERAAVPTGEDRVGPFLQWHGYTSDFLRTFDLDTLGLQEDERLGHDLWVRVYPVLRGLGSSRDFLGTYAAAAYGVPIGDGLVRGAVESTIEATDREITDGSIKGALGIATPRFGFGRFVSTTSALNRYKNYLNVQSYVGGETLLRGYPSRYFAGKDVVATNLEFRTRSFDLSSILLGGALFYDVASAFDGFDRVRPQHGAGGGLRVVFPQIERAVLRFDLGVPLVAGQRPSDVPPVSFFVAFHQAVVIPAVGTDLAP